MPVDVRSDVPPAKLADEAKLAALQRLNCRFCKRCGAAMQLAVPPGEDDLRHVCGGCAFVDYHNPKMVVGCVIEHEGKVLLCKRALEPCAGLWTLPAGYMELGETCAGAQCPALFCVATSTPCAKAMRMRAVRDLRFTCATLITMAAAHALHSQSRAAVRLSSAVPSSRGTHQAQFGAASCHWRCQHGPCASAEGAARETWEEAEARIHLDAPYAHLDIPVIGQTYMFFRGRLAEPHTFGAGPESAEVRLFEAAEIPFEELAFSSVRLTLQQWVGDKAAGAYSRRHGVIRKKPGASYRDPDAFTFEDTFAA